MIFVAQQCNKVRLFCELILRISIPEHSNAELIDIASSSIVYMSLYQRTQVRWLNELVCCNYLIWLNYMVQSKNPHQICTFFARKWKYRKNLVIESKNYSKSICERLEWAQNNSGHLSKKFFGQILTFGNFFSPQVPDGPSKMKFQQNRHRWAQSIPMPSCSENLGRIGAQSCNAQVQTWKNWRLGTSFKPLFIY